MKREIIQTSYFVKEISGLQKKGNLLEEDFTSFLKDIAQNPEIGDVIPGTGGVRKTRLKSASKGKRGGFRVCYYYFVVKERIYLLSIYAKNEQEDLTTDEKKDLKAVVAFFKRDSNE